MHWVGILFLIIITKNAIWAQNFATIDYNAKIVIPILNDSLRHPNITLASNGYYYLTGTQGGKNWAYSNTTIDLWRSKDLKNWEQIKNIWNQDKHAKFKLPVTSLPGTYHSQKTTAFRSPEIAEINKDFYLIYSQASGGICICKSTTKNAEGPYKAHAVLRNYGVDPSLFQDKDGKIYLSFNGGFVALLKEDLTAVAEHPKYIYPEIELKKGWGLPETLDRIGTYGAKIFKRNGKYCISAGDAHWRMNTYCHDLFISESKNDIYGPYVRRYMAVPHASNGSVFQDKNKQWWSTYSGNEEDPYALFSGQTGLVPLAEFKGKDYDVIRPTSKVICEKGPIGNCHPIKDLKDQFSRDPSICIGHDSAYYMVCTIEKESLAPNGGIKMWRSTNLHNWEYLGFVWTWKKDCPEWLKKRNLNDCFWAPEINYINGKYYIVVSLSQTPRGIMMLESKPNKPSGPYHDPIGSHIASGIDGFLFKDIDKTVYFLWGNGHIAPMKKDMSGFAEKPWHIKDQNRTALGYEGIGIIRHNGKYIIHAADHSGDHNGSYDMTYVVADDIRGPYSKRTVTLPHVGHTTIFKGLDEKWYCSIFGSTGNYSFHNRFGLLELEITDDFKFIVKNTKIGY